MVYCCGCGIIDGVVTYNGVWLFLLLVAVMLWCVVVFCVS